MLNRKSCLVPSTAIAVIALVVSANGQDSAYEDVMEFNRMAQSFSTALNLIDSHDLTRPDPLRTTAEQRIAFREFNERREALSIRFFDTFRADAGEEERKAVRDDFARECKALEKELKEVILLPFQAERLEQATFLGMVMNYYQGNYAKAIDMPYYSQRFGLDEQQRSQLSKLRKSLDEKKSAVRNECKERVAKVETDSREKLEKLFNGEQLEFIEEISGGRLTGTAQNEKSKSK